MPAQPKSAAEFIAWREAGMLSRAEADTPAPSEEAGPVEQSREQLRDHLLASLDRNVDKAARKYAAGRLDADGLLAIGPSPRR
jgi:hypothetical protein